MSKTSSPKPDKSGKSKSDKSAKTDPRVPAARPDPSGSDMPFDDPRAERGRRGPRGSRGELGGPSDRAGRGERGGRGDGGRHRGGPHGEHRRGAPRVRRGEVRNAVIASLAEGPKHGYQIIQDLGERSGGIWTPSPGSIYPILHRLASAGVVEAEEVEEGRRVFSLTPKGRLVADRLDASESEPWTTGPVESDEAKELRRLAAQLDGAVAQVADVATTDQLVRAAAIVAESRRKLYALLAEDPSAPTTEPTVS